VGVSWDDAVAYASWAGMSLPTEAQWEYAARAGTTTAYWSGDSESDLARVGWYRGNSGLELHAVGGKPANAWGLHDVHGNPWEWPADWEGDYPSSPQTDPTGPATSPGRWFGRVTRGGCQYDSPDLVRAARRLSYAPEPVGGDRVGFRVAKMISTGATPLDAHAVREENFHYTPENPSKGDPRTAPVVIVGFSEFQCPFCARVLPTLDKIQETYGDQVAIVFRHYPLPMHKESYKAAEAGQCANDQGRFWEMHDLLFQKFQNQGRGALQVKQLKGYAAQIGLNQTTFDHCLDSGEHAATVEADTKAGKAAGVSGVPTFFVNGQSLKGAQPFHNFANVIDAALKAERQPPARPGGEP